MTWTPPFTPDPRLFPFESRWWDADVSDADFRGRVHYVDEGTGPTILFLHGNPTWSFLYRGIIVRLRKQFRCIALDLPGFGLSQEPSGDALRPEEHADVVAAFVRHMDLQDLTIMGQDWGGPIGLRVAVDEIERLRALVMGNTWYWPADRWQMKTFSYGLSTQIAQDGILKKNFFVEKLMPQGVQIKMAPEVHDHYREALPSPRRREGAALLPREILRSAGWLADLAEDVPRALSNVPLLLTWGVNDLAFPPHLIDRFRDDFTSVKVSRLNAKHYIQEDAPGEISAAITAFLGSLPG